jgi:hypothetical protein
MSSPWFTTTHSAPVGLGSSLRFVRSLLRLDLVDGLHLWLYPLLLGSGKGTHKCRSVLALLRQRLPPP